MIAIHGHAPPSRGSGCSGVGVISRVCKLRVQLRETLSALRRPVPRVDEGRWACDMQHKSFDDACCCSPIGPAAGDHQGANSGSPPAGRRHRQRAGLTEPKPPDPALRPPAGRTTPTASTPSSRSARGPAFPEARIRGPSVADPSGAPLSRPERSVGRNLHRPARRPKPGLASRLSNVR